MIFGEESEVQFVDGDKILMAYTLREVKDIYSQLKREAIYDELIREGYSDSQLEQVDKNSDEFKKMIKIAQRVANKMGDGFTDSLSAVIDYLEGVESETLVHFMENKHKKLEEERRKNEERAKSEKCM